MNPSLAIRSCRIVAPDKLADRLLACDVIYQQPSPILAEQVALVYLFEVTKPWFPSSQLLNNIGKTLSQEIQKFVPGEGLATQFESLLKAVNQTLNRVSETGETDWIGNLNGLIAIVSGDQLHFSQTGISPAYLLQRNRIRQITDDPSEQERDQHPLKTFSTLASGVLQVGDYLLFANQELYKEISLDALRRVMNNSTPYRASQTITKELKKEKNSAISTVILQLTTAKDILETEQEPQELILEDEMQGQLKQFQKRLAPVVHKTKETSKRVALQTQKVITTKVLPQANQLLKQGIEGGRQVQNRLQSLRKETRPVVEIILPASSPTFSPQDASIAPSGEKLITLTGLQDKAKKTYTSSKSWLSLARNRKIAIATCAVLLLVITSVSLYKRHRSATVVPEDNTNAKALDTAQDLATKATTAIQLKQDNEANREVEQGENALSSLKNPSSTQATKAEAIRTSLTTLADTLSSTTRFSAAVTTYSFSVASQSLISNTPYFYGDTPDLSQLLRARQGDNAQAATNVSGLESGDSITSLTKGSDADTAAIALTRQGKVYRVIQNDDQTVLRSISPASGDWVTGDAISTYVGNIYILDGKSGLLWRYANTGTAYSKGVSLIDTTKYDLKHSVSLAIDGSIYILKQDGTLLKFSAGQQDTSFSLKNLPYLSQKLTQPIQVYTDEDSPTIYILDAGLTSAKHSSAKLLEFNKDGTFTGQYAFPDDMTDVRAFDLNLQDKKLWVLNGQQIKEFNL